MRKYFVLKPEVAGGFGENTVMIDPSARPPRLDRFHYRFDGWLGDELLTAVACFIVSQGLANTLIADGFSGFTIGDVKVDKSGEYERRAPCVLLPQFVWLKVDGKPGEDDFGIAADRKYRLVVSGNALSSIKRHVLNHCEVVPY